MSALALQSGYVRVTEHGKLLEVTLDRADKLNALSGEMYRDISRAVDHYRDRDDPEVKAKYAEFQQHVVEEAPNPFLVITSDETNEQSVMIVCVIERLETR